MNPHLRRGYLLVAFATIINLQFLGSLLVPPRVATAQQVQQSGTTATTAASSTAMSTTTTPSATIATATTVTATSITTATAQPTTPTATAQPTTPTTATAQLTTPTATARPTTPTSPALAPGVVYYVSRNGSNSNGRSWATAWNELKNINWSIIRPGDTIFIDGGLTSMVYNTTLTVRKSGLPQAPIRILAADELNHNGQVVIDGGRLGSLPYCDQVPATWNYATDENAMRSTGIVNDQSWVIIDGQHWRGIRIVRHDSNGLSLLPGTSNLMLRNLEITDNGRVGTRSNGRLFTDGAGIKVTGINVTIERAIIYDNGQDAIQSASSNTGIANLVVRESWFYNSAHPIFGDKWAKNSHEDNDSCTHADGIQIYNGGADQRGVLVEDSVFGPRLQQAIILGDSCPTCGNTAVANLTVRNSLLHNSTSQEILMHPSGNVPWPNNWRVERSTLHSNGGSNIVIRGGTGHVLRDSIFMGGTINVQGEVSTTNNCQWNAWGITAGIKIDPLFMDPLGSGNRTLADFRLAAGSPCAGKGASITSAQQLVGRLDTPNDRRPQQVTFLPMVKR